MNNRLLDLLIEFDEMGYAPTTICEDAEEYAKKWENRVWEEVKSLEAENAELRARLNKAVEFPFENLDKVFILAGEDTNEKQFIPDRIVEDTIVGFGYDVYENEKQFIPDRIVEGTIVGFGYDVYEWVDGNYKFNYYVLVGENNYIFALEQFNKTLFKTREAAEVRLAELKGEKI